MNYNITLMYSDKDKIYVSTYTRGVLRLSDCVITNKGLNKNID